ncbi:MAG: hypothetical protein PVF15_06665 [Candidatus Bathyarchaeota archaeon]
MKEEAMKNKYLKILTLIGGLLVAVFGLLWAVSLYFQGQLVENSGPVVIIISVGLILVIMGWKE